MVERRYSLPDKSEAYRPVLDEFIDRVEKGQLAEGLVLFGSSARGEATPESDLDVLTVTDQDWQSKRPHITRILREVRETSAYKILERDGVVPQVYPFYVETRQLDAPP